MTETTPETTPVEAVYPLTSLQEGMLLESLDAGDSRAYLSQVRYTLGGQVDVDLLRRAWLAVAAKHHALRACVAYSGLTTAVQAVYREPFDLLRVADGRYDDDALARHLGEDLAAGFDLERAPLHRVSLLRRADDSWEMVWTSHHLMIDGWSIPIVISDVLIGYGQAAAGRPIDLAPTASYRDYVAWVAGRDRSQVVDHWRRTLRGFTEPTPLPAAGPGDPTAAGRAVLDTVLPVAPTAGLAERGRRDRVTLNTLAQAAWAVVLARFSGRDDVLFGATVSGRPPTLPGVEAMVGLFINTLPVRVRLPRRIAVTAWLQDLQRRFLASREFEEASLRDIRSVAQVPRDRSLFDSIVVVENYPLVVDERFEDRRPPVDILAASSREELAHPLVLSVTGGEQTSIELFHDTARIPDPAARAMLDAFTTVLVALATDGAATVADLLAAVPAAVPLTGGPPPDDIAPVADQIRARAEAAPDAVAVVDGGRTVSYADLVGAADRGAARLVAAGVAPGATVALLADRSADRVAACLAVWFAGAAFVPLDPAWPPARVAALLARVDPALVLTDAPTATPGDAPTAGPGAGLPQLSLSELLAAGPQPPAAGPAAGPHGPDGRPASIGGIAYTIFTSGTSGVPKPVVVGHRALAAAVAGWAAAHDFATRGRRHLHLANPAFDVSVGELLRALCAGQTLVVARRAVGDDPAALLDLIIDARVDVVDLPPSLLRPLLDEAELAGQRLDTLSTVLIGGEAWFARDYVRLAGFVGPQTRIVNAYGITETGIDSAYAVIGTVAGQAESLWLDAAYPGVTLAVVDGAGRRLPAGARGEVWLSGAALAAGYDRDPARTALRFVPDEWSAVAGGRAYRTGDAAAIDDRGRLHLRGRVDDQLSVHGHRIEPQEVEAALVAHRDISAAAVTVRDGQLVGFVTSPAATPDLAAVRAHLGTLLPSYTIPQLVRLDALPTTANGKLDRAALPTTVDGPRHGEGYLAPTTPTQRALVEVWQEVLGVERVGVRDNFFDLGGDSIAGLRIKGRAAGWQIELRPRDVFTYQTVAELAGYVDSRDAGATAEVAVRVGEVPLLPVQRLYLDHVGDDPAHYDMAQGIRLNLVCDPATARTALAGVARRHGALRTRFRDTGAGWRQWVEADPDPLVTLRVTDLRGLSGARRDAAHRSVVDALRSTTDLADAPLWSCVLLIADDHTTAYFAVHHLVMDIYSWRLLLQEFVTDYRTLAAGGTPDVRPVPGFPEYAVAAAAEVRGDRAGELERQWLQMIGTPQPVPTTRSDGPNTMAAVRMVHGGVSRAATTTLHQLRGGPAAVSPVMVTLLAALARAYGRWSGTDLYVFVETHGRESPVGGLDLSAAVGWFTALYPASVPYRPTAGFADVWWQVHDLLAAVPQPVVSFGLLRDGVDPAHGRALADLPLPQIALNHVGSMSVDADGADRDGVTVVPVPSLVADPTARRDQLLEIESGVTDGQFQFGINYSSHHFDEAAVEKLAALLCEELENLPETIERND